MTEYEMTRDFSMNQKPVCFIALITD